MQERWEARPLRVAKVLRLSGQNGFVSFRSRLSISGVGAQQGLSHFSPAVKKHHDKGNL